MSRVCNIVLLSLDGINSAPIKNLNAYLKKREHGQLEEISKHAGGFKAIESNIYAVACNYLTADEFIEVFKEQMFQFPSEACLLIKDEHEEEWSKYAASAPEPEPGIPHRQQIIKKALIIKASKQLKNCPEEGRKVIMIDDGKGSFDSYEITKDGDIENMDVEDLKIENLPGTVDKVKEVL